jgi:hypothetical protein
MENKNKNEGSKKDKISLAEIILVGLLLATIDILQGISLIFSPVPVIGQAAVILSTAVGLCITMLVQFYLTMKKVGGVWFVASGLFPVKSLVWVGMCFVINNPKLEKVAKVASKLAI